LAIAKNIVTVQCNVVLKLFRCGDISPSGGCKPLADLSCVPFEASKAMFATFAVALRYKISIDN